MAKTGSPSKVSESGSGRSVETRRQLVEAAIGTLKEVGFAGASARAIAERAGATQGSVFYHFGSVANLLLAALDAVSEQRLTRYNAAVAGVSTPVELVEVARTIFSEDLNAGYVTVLAQLIAGTSSTPGLGTEVAARMGPWTDFARRAVEDALADSPLRQLLPGPEVAHGIVALYLGLEMLSHLDGDRAPAMALFDRAGQLAGLLAALGGSVPHQEAS
jgi:AcrR family transcriptional regulator